MKAAPKLIGPVFKFAVPVRLPPETPASQVTRADPDDFDEHTPPPRVKPAANAPPRFVRLKAAGNPLELLAVWIGDGRLSPLAVCVRGIVPDDYRRWRAASTIEVGYPSNTFLILTPPELT